MVPFYRREFLSKEGLASVEGRVNPSEDDSSFGLRICYEGFELDFSDWIVLPHHGIEGVDKHIAEVGLLADLINDYLASVKAERERLLALSVKEEEG